MSKPTAEIDAIARNLYELFDQYKRSNEIPDIELYKNSIHHAAMVINSYIRDIQGTKNYSEANGLSILRIQEEAKLEAMLWIKDELQSWSEHFNQKFNELDAE